MDADHRLQIEAYVAMAREFAADRAEAKSFQLRFIAEFKKDQRLYGDAAADILMDFFNDAECFEPDPELLKRLRERDPDLYIDEAQFRAKAVSFVQKAGALLRAGA